MYHFLNNCIYSVEELLDLNNLILRNKQLSVEVASGPTLKRWYILFVQSSLGFQGLTLDRVSDLVSLFKLNARLTVLLGIETEVWRHHFGDM